MLKGGEKKIKSLKLKVKNSARGFTLVELLIVIAVLGVLAAVLLVVINPIEQLARGRDSGRKGTVSQLGNAVQAYYTSHNAAYPTAVTGTTVDWITKLIGAGEVKTVPTNPAYSITGTATCTGNAQSNWCYSTNTTEAIVYARMESTSEDSKCATGQSAFYVWSSANGRAGLVCTADAGGAAVEPTVISTGQTFVE